MDTSELSSNLTGKPGNSDWLRARAIPLLAVGLPFLLYLVLSFPLADWLVDDAAISLSYSRNLAFGHGLTAQQGVPPVEGYSNFLWVVLMVPLFWLHLVDPIITSKVVASIFVLLTFLTIDRTIRRCLGGGAVTSFITLALQATNASFVIWTCSGLENSLYALGGATLLFWGCRWAVEPEQLPTRSLLTAGAIAGGVALTRPDGIFLAMAFVTIGFILAVFRERPLRRHAISRWLLTVSTFCAVYGGYLLFRRFYFGDWFPNTYFAKGGPEFRYLGKVLTLTEPYLSDFLNLVTSQTGTKLRLLVLAASIASFTYVVVHRQWRRSFTFAGILTVMAAILYLWMPRDYLPEFRFATPWFVLFTTLTCATFSLMISAIKGRGIRFSLVAAAMILVVVTSIRVQAPRLSTWNNSPPISFARVTTDYVTRFAAYRDFLGVSRVSVLLPDIGAPLWHDEFRVYDLAGLTDRTIARNLNRNFETLHAYVLDSLKPDFIHTHGTWTYRSRFELHPHFARDYVAISEYDDKWVTDFSSKVVKKPIRLKSGDYVRRDLLRGDDRFLERMQSWPNEPASDTLPLVASFEKMVTPFDRLARRVSQGFVRLEPRALPNSNIDTAHARKYLAPLDADSVEMLAFDGGTYYAPVYLTHRIYHFLGAFRRTADSVFLKRAEKTAARLLTECHRFGDTLFVPYYYPFKVHGDPALALSPPWYSGMAQGEFLSVLVRLHEATGRPGYLGAADSVFRSLLRLPSASAPWVMQVDSAGYLWLEEFPRYGAFDQTLNGFVAGLYGVYDYYRVTSDERARTIFDMSVTTLKRYLPEIRRPGALSYYCLGHNKVAERSYHELHVSMMGHLFRMTGDSSFAAMEWLLQSDTPHNDD